MKKTNRNECMELLERSFRQTDIPRLLKSAEIYGTPHYFLDRERLRRRAAGFMETFLRHLPRTRFFYAFKCNDLPYLTAVLRDTGYNADVAGLFELQLARRLQFPRIVFGGPGKSPAELACALEDPERITVIVDNPDEYALVEEMSRNLRYSRPISLGFRLNMEPSGEGVWSKFGSEPRELAEMIRRVEAAPALQWTGVHFHCSWNKTPEKYVRNIRQSARILRDCASPEQLRQLKFVDIGGGFYPEDMMELDGPHAYRLTPVDPLQTFAEAVAGAVREYLDPINPALELFVEPGRFIVTHSTSVLLRVIGVKGDRLITDGGINMLGDYKFSEYSVAPVINLSRPVFTIQKQVVYGPLCDPGDLWGYEYIGGRAEKGDILAVLHQGAYTFSTAWRFIKPLPAYIAGTEEGFVEVMIPETFGDRYRGCLFPGFQD